MLKPLDLSAAELQALLPVPSLNEGWGRDSSLRLTLAQAGDLGRWAGFSGVTQGQLDGLLATLRVFGQLRDHALAARELALIEIKVAAWAAEDKAAAASE